RQLPDKAIDLVDEAASRLRMELDSSPVEIDELRRAVDRLKMEESYLSDSDDEASADRLEKLRAELADSAEELAALNARWEAERGGHGRGGDREGQLGALRTAAGRAQREGDLRAACRLLYGEIPAVQEQIAAAEKAEEDAGAVEPMIADKVGVEEIAEVVAAW